MTSTGKLFKECVANIPEEVKLEIGWSDAIAGKIAAKLSEQGLTQKMFAKKMGKTDAEVSRWLSGTHNFTLRTISKISAVLNTNMIDV